MRGKRITIGKNPIIIRKATTNDIDKLVELRILQQKDDWKLESNVPTMTIKTTSFLSGFLMNDSNGIIIVAEKNNNIIATCGLQIMELMPQYNDNGKYGYIFNVFTLEDFRRHGVQSKLLSEIINYAKSLNITEISLETDNDVAVHMYEKCGFVQNNLFMTKQISGV